MDKAALIRHEIEKRRVHNLAIGNPLFKVMAEEDIELLCFIDSLQEEPVNYNKLNTMLNDALLKETKESWNEKLGKEEPVSEDLLHIRHRDTLDEFAYQCAYDLSNDWAKETPEWKDVKTACKLGAQWQKEQMIAKAIDARCFGFQGAALFSFRLPASNYLVGSKVKVIVIKEDEL